MVFTVLTNHRFRLILVGLSRTGERRELPSTSQGRRGFLPGDLASPHANSFNVQIAFGAESDRYPG